MLINYYIPNIIKWHISRYITVSLKLMKKFSSIHDCCVRLNRTITKDENKKKRNTVEVRTWLQNIIKHSTSIQLQASGNDRRTSFLSSSSISWADACSSQIILDYWTFRWRATKSPGTNYATIFRLTFRAVIQSISNLANTATETNHCMRSIAVCAGIESDTFTETNTVTYYLWESYTVTCWRGRSYTFSS